ncbi:AAA family ATPase [Paludicola sp. MB14-C6]|uniref:AAA family ATPase n=1 Tax=Paludihabitans sp. MB14-C6 TaxID=3070656 RepID=UPI0027DDC45A|nr:AAA family ATPase [Paludicola sp. MB14-C6]WMJ23818.1 AAA family ATPase [Paludicola sp. MB14-C6]
MIIQDNIIKYNLKNVIFVCGTACGGKTTMSKLLAEKHNLYLYDMDKMYEYHREVANEKYQPDMCYHMKDFYQQWTRSAEEQARWNMNSLREQTEMVLIDLMTLSRNQRVIADVLYSPIYTTKILDYNQLVFLTVNKSIIRDVYFNRPEKRDFFEFVAKQELSHLYFENLFKGLELTNELEQKQMKASGLFVYERKATDTQESVLHLLEEHFHL